MAGLAQHDSVFDSGSAFFPDTIHIEIGFPGASGHIYSFGEIRHGYRDVSSVESIFSEYSRIDDNLSR